MEWICSRSMDWNGWCSVGEPKGSRICLVEKMIGAMSEEPSETNDLEV